MVYTKFQEPESNCSEGMIFEHVSMSFYGSNPKLLAKRWLFVFFGFNGPLRQYFSLYRAVFQEREKEEKKARGE